MYKWNIGSLRVGFTFCIAGICLLSVHRPVWSEALELIGYEGQPLVEEAVPAFPFQDHTPISGDRVRIAFYNIEMFTDGIKDGKNRTEERALKQARGAATIIDEMAPDILFVSEVENDRVMGYINDAMPNPFPVGYIVQFGTQSGRGEKMNIGLFSRFTPESVHELDFGPLTGPGRPTRGVVRAIFELGDDHALLVYGVHLKANWGEKTRNYSQRVNAMSLVRDDVKKVVSENTNRVWEVMLLGDLNTDPMLNNLRDDPTIKVLSDWIDLWSVHLDISDLHTIPTRRGDPMREFPPALFDRILVHPELQQKPWHVSLPSVIMKGTETSDVNVLPGEGAHVSDHYPVYVDMSK